MQRLLHIIYILLLIDISQAVQPTVLNVFSYGFHFIRINITDGQVLNKSNLPFHDFSYMGILEYENDNFLMFGADITFKESNKAIISIYNAAENKFTIKEKTGADFNMLSVVGDNYGYDAINQIVYFPAFKYNCFLGNVNFNLKQTTYFSLDINCNNIITDGYFDEHSNIYYFGYIENGTKVLNIKMVDVTNNKTLDTYKYDLDLPNEVLKEYTDELFLFVYKSTKMYTCLIVWDIEHSYYILYIIEIDLQYNNKPKNIIKIVNQPMSVLTKTFVYDKYNGYIILVLFKEDNWENIYIKTLNLESNEITLNSTIKNQLQPASWILVPQ